MFNILADSSTDIDLGLVRVLGIMMGVLFVLWLLTRAFGGGSGGGSSGSGSSRNHDIYNNGGVGMGGSSGGGCGGSGCGHGCG